MLLGNYAYQNRNCVKEWGGFSNPLINYDPTVRANIYTTDTLRSGFDKSALPNGYNTESAWYAAFKTGGMGSTLNIVGSGSASANILAVKLLQASITGDGELTATGSLIVQLLAAINGTGAVTDADIQAFLLMVASIGGSGDMDGTITGLAELLADLTGTGTLEDSVITGLAEMIADLVVTGTGLTTANVGSAVWGANAAANNVAGTMGEKLNDAGGASNPWTEVIESGYTAADILKLLAAATSGKMTVAGSSITFTGIDGVTERIAATMSGGGRSDVDLDVS